MRGDSRRSLPGSTGARPSISGGSRDVQALESRSQQAALGTRRRRTRAILISGLIVVFGCAGSVLLASERRSDLLRADRQSFKAAAADLSGALDSKLDSGLQLTRTLRTIATLEPNAGDTRFAGLPAFRRAALSDPASRAFIGGVFAVVPSGRRSVYCLTRASVGHTATTSLYPPLLDYCAPVTPGFGRSPFAGLIRTARDTGSTIVTLIPGLSLVAVGEAVYRQGTPLTTVAQRRAAITGVIGTSFDAGALIGPLLAGYRSLSLTLYHRNIGGPLQLIGRAGAASRGYTERKNLGEGWVVQVAGNVSATPDLQGAAVLGSGLLVTFLIFMLYEVLTRSRQQAWGLVGEKTGELEHTALHDLLTDLPNRHLVLDRAEQIIARARRLDVPVTALFVDIDGFKQVNDRYGHQAGDEILRQVGTRLRTVLRDNDTVGRMGGDEFVMLIDSVGLDAAPELVAQRILDVLRQPIRLAKGAHSPLSLTASIGIATGRMASAEDLMADADLALYKAKTVGKNGYVQFESAMHTAAQDRIHLEMDLADALAGNQMFLVYQPMLDLQSEKVVGVEALLRWHHPTDGVIPPDSFIPIAEENGLILTLGRWVLESACAQAVIWHKRGFPLNMSVNVSARQLERAEFVQEVREALHENAMDPAMLTLEITETVLMRNPDITAKLLDELKALGVRIAVDDFGTGYSSLAYLRQFPVDSLKIDRAFITGLELSSEAHALTHTLIQLGKALGLQTLAEGVEHHDQVRELQREGCDLAQGFLFARPLTANAIESFLRASPRLTGNTAQAQPALSSGR
jgi:diguanylate cyclase (GGDEF)-like protein